MSGPQKWLTCPDRSPTTPSLVDPQPDGTIQSVYHPGTTADYNADVQVAQPSAAGLQAEFASNATIAS